VRDRPAADIAELEHVLRLPAAAPTVNHVEDETRD
jgi:hypothetical protein